MKIGAQLMTVSKFVQTEADFAESMQKIAAMGYTGVQLSQVGPLPAQFMADTCAANGLEIVNTHKNLDVILAETDTLIAEHKTMGARQMGIPWVNAPYRGEGAGQRLVADILPLARKINAAGLKLAYHNHAFEFEPANDGMFQAMVDGTTAEELEIILDVFWVQAAGECPVEWLKKLAGRVPTVHYKDMIFVPKEGGTAGETERRFAEVGHGILDWPAIIEASRQAGVEWVLVEQDNCYGRNPFESLRMSYAFLEGKI